MERSVCLFAPSAQQGRLWKTAALVSCRLVSVGFLCKCERMWTSVPGVELQHEVPITHTLARVFCGAIRQREFRKYQAGIMRSVCECVFSQPTGVHPSSDSLLLR